MIGDYISDFQTRRKGDAAKVKFSVGIHLAMKLCQCACRAHSGSGEQFGLAGVQALRDVVLNVSPWHPVTDHKTRPRNTS